MLPANSFLDNAHTAITNCDIVQSLNKSQSADIHIEKLAACIKNLQTNKDSLKNLLEFCQEFFQGFFSLDKERQVTLSRRLSKIQLPEDEVTLPKTAAVHHLFQLLANGLSQKTAPATNKMPIVEMDEVSATPETVEELLSHSTFKKLCQNYAHLCNLQMSLACNKLTQGAHSSTSKPLRAQAANMLSFWWGWKAKVIGSINFIKGQLERWIECSFTNLNDDRLSNLDTKETAKKILEKSAAAQLSERFNQLHERMKTFLDGCENGVTEQGDQKILARCRHELCKLQSLVEEVRLKPGDGILWLDDAINDTIETMVKERVDLQNFGETKEQTQNFSSVVKNRVKQKYALMYERMERNIHKAERLVYEIVFEVLCMDMDPVEGNSKALDLARKHPTSEKVLFSPAEKIRLPDDVRNQYEILATPTLNQVAALTRCLFPSGAEASDSHCALVAETVALELLVNTDLYEDSQLEEYAHAISTYKKNEPAGNFVTLQAAANCMGVHFLVFDKNGGAFLFKPKISHTGNKKQPKSTTVYYLALVGGYYWSLKPKEHNQEIQEKSAVSKPDPVAALLKNPGRGNVLSLKTLSFLNNKTPDDAVLPADESEALVETCYKYNKLTRKDLSPILSPNLVRFLVKDSGQVDDDIMKLVTEKSPNLKRVNISGCLKVRSIAPIATRLKDSVEDLDISGCCFVDNILPLAECKKLKRLEMAGVQSVVSNTLDSVLNSCEELEHLNIAGCRQLLPAVFTDTTKQLRLQSLKAVNSKAINNQSVESIAKRCPNLRSIDFGGADCDLADTGLVALKDNCKNLEQVSLSNLKSITSAGIDALIESGNLASLIIINCPEAFTSKPTSVPAKLQKLVIKDAKVRDEIIIPWLQQCGETLKHLDLTNSTITDKTLEAIGKYCPNLEKCILSNVSQITDDGMAQLLVGCKTLKKLDLSKTTVTGRCLLARELNLDMLKTLDLSKCPNLTDNIVVEITTTLKGKNAVMLPSLKNLKLYDNRQITDVGLIPFLQALPTSLTFLDIQSCINASDQSLMLLCERFLKLEKLNICFCTFSLPCVVKGVASLAHLRELFIRGIVNGTPDYDRNNVLRSLSLQTLVADGCQNMSDAMFIEILRLCPNLRDLSVNRCVKLTKHNVEAGIRRNSNIFRVKMAEGNPNLFPPIGGGGGQVNADFAAHLRTQLGVFAETR